MLRAILRAIPDLILVVNKAGIVIYGKPPREAIPGMPEGDFVGRDVREILPAWAERNMQYIDRVLESGAYLITAYSFEVGGQIRYHECQLGASDSREVVSVVRDVTARRLAEEERRRIQEVLIQAQAAALVELSTPIIPIHDQVVVVPLVGTIDVRRSELVLSALLDGITSRQARVAILDITGVSFVDVQVVDALVRAAQAIRLVGAQMVVTGMRPEVALRVVELGVDLAGIITHSTLESGIAYAMGELGKAGPR